MSWVSSDLPRAPAPGFGDLRPARVRKDVIGSCNRVVRVGFRGDWSGYPSLLEWFGRTTEQGGLKCARTESDSRRRLS